jgi:hypothetical protein
MSLLNMSTVDCAWGGVGDEDVADGAAGLTNEMAIGWRFDNVPNCLV